MKRGTNTVDIDAMMDERFGVVGSEARDEFRKEAYNYCVSQLISNARKQERMTQSELAVKIGASKSYISRIEKGLIEPGVGTFFRIIDALGLRCEIVKPMPSPYSSYAPKTYLSDSKPDNEVYCSKRIVPYRPQSEALQEDLGALGTLGK